MPRYIDADRLRDSFGKSADECRNRKAEAIDDEIKARADAALAVFLDCILRVEIQPAADVEEVRRREWISVEERLPEEDGEYLAGWYGSDEIVLARFTRDCFGMHFRLLDPEKEHRPAFYYEDDEWGTCEWEDIECWTQKPVPPKEAP